MSVHNYFIDKKFVVLPPEIEIPFGWRLASVDEIKKDGTYTDAALDAMSDGPSKTGFLCLDNDFKVVK